MAHNTFLKDWVAAGEPDPDRVTRYLREIHRAYGTLTTFFVSEATRTYYQAEGVLKKVSRDHWRDKWYFRVREMERDYELNIDPDLANEDTMTAFINYRVLNDKGEFIGATGVGLAVSTMKQLIEDYQRRYDRRIYFVDRTGAIRMHGSQFPEGVENLRQMEGAREIADDVLNSRSGTFRYRRDGYTIHMNVRWIEEFGWYVVVEQAETGALADVRRALIINLGACVVIVAMVLTGTALVVSAFQRDVEHMATTDKLTGCYNRRAFGLLFHEARLDAQRNQHPLSIAQLDIDRFKAVNDRLGHAAGDRVLQHLTARLGEVLRASDVLCRWGGEEFLILLKGCSGKDAFQATEKLRQAVEAMTTKYQGNAIRVTVSAGVAEYREGDTQAGLVRRADVALYAAKRKGRNRTEVAAEDA